MKFKKGLMAYIMRDNEVSNHLSDPYTPYKDWKRDVANSVLKAVLRYHSNVGKSDE